MNENNLKSVNNNVKSTLDFSKQSDSRFFNKSKFTNLPNFKDILNNRYSTLNDHYPPNNIIKDGPKSEDTDMNYQEIVNFEEIPIIETDSRRSHSNVFFEELIKQFGQKTLEKVKKKFSSFSKNIEINL